VDVFAQQRGARSFAGAGENFLKCFTKLCGVGTFAKGFFVNRSTKKNNLQERLPLAR
jgi:hypothetical protein